MNSDQNFGDKVLFRVYGDRYQAYRDKWGQACRGEIVTEFPLYLQFELTPHCNLACPYCIHGVIQLKNKYINIRSSLDFDKVLKEAALFKCPSISFHNNNEPFLTKDLEDKIYSARKSGFIDLIITTNATLLSRERTLKLLEAGLTKISFSIDAFSEKTYQQNRKNGNFSEVISNILFFLEMKQQKKYDLPITRVTFLINRNNYMEVEQFQEYWQDKVDLVDFQNFSSLVGFTESLCPPNFIKSEDFKCTFPWQQLVIRANGDVLPCCSFYGSDIILGNVAKSSIFEIWHGNLMKDIRSSLSMGIFPKPSCEQCAQSFYEKGV